MSELVLEPKKLGARLLKPKQVAFTQHASGISQASTFRSQCVKLTRWQNPTMAWYEEVLRIEEAGWG